MERTCILVKPDGVGQKRVGKVVDRLEMAGLRLVGMKLMRLSQAQAAEFYKEHHGKPFYPPLVTFMTSAPIVATVWEGAGAVAAARALMGATNSPVAEPGTLRRAYGTDNRYNLVHGSDSTGSAQREINFFFKPEELLEYKENDWRN
jgi:nucleoside-diphosphate kinase